MAVLPDVELIPFSHNTLFSCLLLDSSLSRLKPPKITTENIKTKLKPGPPSSSAFLTPHPTSAFLNLPLSFISSQTCDTPAAWRWSTDIFLTTHQFHTSVAFLLLSNISLPNLSANWNTSTFRFSTAAQKEASSDPRETKVSLGCSLPLGPNLDRI